MRNWQLCWKDYKLKKFKFFLVLFTIFFLFINCSDNGSSEVEGYVIYVESDSLTTINSLIIKDRNNKEWIFEGTEKFKGFTPSHLLEHRDFGEPVLVEYVKKSNVLEIISIKDIN